MTAHCHIDKATANRDRRILWTVLVINFAMFALEIWLGLAADSTSLIADSMDFLSDSFSYGITLYVLTMPLRARANASLIKASLMLLLAAGALAQGVHNLVANQIPHFETMGWVGLLALIANVVSAMMLYGSRSRDSNMRSVWLCSRNDAFANIGIIIAAGLVYLTGTLWPDLVVALAIAWLEGSSALKIIAQAREELRHGQ
jgi:Co/Zn/Cd efflux system component